MKMTWKACRVIFYKEEERKVNIMFVQGRGNHPEVTASPRSTSYSK